MCITVALLPSQICGNILKKTVDVSLQTIKNGITQGEKTDIRKQTTRRLKTGIHQNDKTRICVLINSPLLKKSFSLQNSCDRNYGIPLQCRLLTKPLEFRNCLISNFVPRRIHNSVKKFLTWLTTTSWNCHVIAKFRNFKIWKPFV